MASMANNIQKILRHHVPMIRFKYGASQSDSAIHPAHESDTKSKTPVASGASPAAPSKSVQNSVTLDFSEVPKRYRRRPLTEEEIDLVAIGGRI